MADQPKKIFLWANPRSLSTAFFRAMMNRPNTKVIMEPFCVARDYGVDGVGNKYKNEVEGEKFSYTQMKKLCEDPHTGHDVVFVKDLAQLGVLDRLQYIPEGYIHTFLIRSPVKTIPSLHKIYSEAGNDVLTSMYGSHKSLYEFMIHVTEKYNQQPIIIDADDILAKPGGMMKLYCEKVGISYHESIVNWEPNPDLSTMLTVPEWEPWFAKILKSTGFEDTEMRKTSEEVPPTIQHLIEDSMVYYHKMYTLRMKINCSK